MHYTLQQLIDRAVSGQIGHRGLHRLVSAGIDPSGLPSSGVDPGNVPDPGAALGIRRQGNYLHALLRKRMAEAAGQEVGAATEARIASGVPGGPGVRLSGDQVPDEVLQSLLASFRQRRGGALSDSSYYMGF